MFTARQDQENAVYQQQHAAAAKLLNQGVKGLAPKTPANKPSKTPFAKTRNDENAKVDHGKPAVKVDQPDRNDFITPAQPRTRAPLGNKTTNVKAFQTPGPLIGQDKLKDRDRSASIKPTSPRLRRSKIKVHDSASTEHDARSEEIEEHEIEYMPPRGVPLPDFDDEVWPHDREYPMFDGSNLTRGWWSEFTPKRDPDMPDLSDYEENIRKCEQRLRNEVAKKEKPSAIKPKDATALRGQPITINARHAASMLGNRPVKKTLSSATASSTAKTRCLASDTAIQSKQPIPNRANPRFTSAKAASKSTIGYSRGRLVSANRRPLSKVSPEPQIAARQPEPIKNSLDDLLILGSMDLDDGDGVNHAQTTSLDLPEHDNGNNDADDEEPEVFQLDPIDDY